MGSSHILQAVDTTYVQAELNKKLGPAGCGAYPRLGRSGLRCAVRHGSGLDGSSQGANARFYDEDNPDNRSLSSIFWFRFGEDARLLVGLPIRDQSLFYFATIIGMPRNLLALLRPDLPAPLVSNPPNYWERHYGSASVVKLLGCTRSEVGFNYDIQTDSFTPFTPFRPHTEATAADAKIYSSGVKNDFEFGGELLPVWQTYFAGKLAELAQANECKLVMLSIPVLADAPVTGIRERAFWPDIFKGDFWLAGISPAKLFGGLTDEQLHWLFTNNAHFNKNGMEYFTPLITPALLQIYESRR